MDWSNLKVSSRSWARWQRTWRSVPSLQQELVSIVRSPQSHRNSMHRLIKTEMWAAQHFRWRYPRTCITSGGLGTMWDHHSSSTISKGFLGKEASLLINLFPRGFGLPAAIGAKVAQPESLVIDIDGDASFQMTLTELTTAAQFNIGVKISMCFYLSISRNIIRNDADLVLVVLNNEEQGMVTQWQNLFYEDRFSHTHQINPDFVKVAEAMGVQADRCIAPGDVESKLNWLINTDGPALLEVVTDQKVPVLPMVPAGKLVTPYPETSVNDHMQWPFWHPCRALHEFLIYDEGRCSQLLTYLSSYSLMLTMPHSQRQGAKSAYEKKVRSLRKSSFLTTWLQWQT